MKCTGYRNCAGGVLGGGDEGRLVGETTAHAAAAGVFEGAGRGGKLGAITAAVETVSARCGGRRGQRGATRAGVGSGGKNTSTSRDGRAPTVVPHARGSRATRRTLMALEPRDGPTDAGVFTHRRTRALSRALVDASVAPARDARPATLAIARGFHAMRNAARARSHARARVSLARRGAKTASARPSRCGADDESVGCSRDASSVSFTAGCRAHRGVYPSADTPRDSKTRTAGDKSAQQPVKTQR